MCVSRFGRRFVALSNAYNQYYLDVAHTVARDLEMTGVKEGVYAFQVGPCYETVTESRMMRLLGADVAGLCLFYTVLHVITSIQRMPNLAKPSSLCIIILLIH